MTAYSGAPRVFLLNQAVEAAESAGMTTDRVLLYGCGAAERGRP